MLRKDLLRVSRRGGYRPRFVAGDANARRLAARVLGVYQGHVGERRGDLESALERLEREADDFKLVRGFAALLEREASFETRAPLPPRRARRAAFEAAEAVGVADERDRERALGAAADDLGVDPESLEASLYADRDVEQVLSSFDPRWDVDELLVQYDLSLAQTALFDATEVRVRSSDPKVLVSAVKRLGLLYEVRRRADGEDDEGTAGSDGSDAAPGASDRVVVVTGPDALFRRTRRYGTAFARLLRAVAASAGEWELVADIDDRGREYELRLTHADVAVPGVEPLAEPAFDSGVEADFAARFRALELDWALVREPEPLATGTSVMIPDFAFVYEHADFRVFFEVMGFWTPEYVEKKLAQLETVEDVDLLVAVNESLGVGEEVVARDHRVITYDGSVRVKDVVDVLREYEADLAAEVTADLPAELVPEADTVGLEALAAEYGVPVEALAAVSFPEHRRVGDTLVRPAVLERVAEEIEPGIEYADAEATLAGAGIPDASAALSALGYRVEWTGLSGGTVREKE